ncbi:MAG TPA: ATP-binding protein [Kofleriaceae bacterium]|nr:ATP-binding protein [Kofleriaceae bacterium]
MKLRGRFTLTLALAALVPIALAAVVTTRSIAKSRREAYDESRKSVERKLLDAIDRREKEIEVAVQELVTTDNPFVGPLLRELVKGTADAWLRVHREEFRGQASALALDTLTITGPGLVGDDTVLVATHDRSAIDAEPQPAIRERANTTRGAAYFTREKKMTSSSIDTLLVFEVAELAHDGSTAVAIAASRRVSDDLLAIVRESSPFLVDARIVSPNGEVLLPSASRDWAELAGGDGPIRIPLLGPDRKPVAIVEAAVSDPGLDELLWKVALTAAALALVALGAVVVLGLFVARRTARDLEALVAGSLAASRGDLDHRVPVRSKDEIGAVAAAFNFMLEDLKTSKDRLVIAERIAAWQEIARRLAHEIKNPLTPIQMAMDTLRKSYKKQHPEFAEILDESTTTVLAEADRLKRIVAEFSDFARMPKAELARVDLNDVVRGSLALHQGAIPVETDLANDLPELDADKGQLNQVLLNLVANARDAIGEREGGKITVRTRRGEGADRALLVVEDNGPGVPAELKDKVFAPYFSTKHGKGGTGLGLAIVHRIVSDHGGRITISDAVGGGARVTIELPLRDGTALLASRI